MAGIDCKARAADTLRSVRSLIGRTGTPLLIAALNALVLAVVSITAIAGAWAGHPGVLGRAVTWLGLPSSPWVLATRPWTAVTYMFTQVDAMHMVLNMLWFYWFATMLAWRDPRPRLLWGLYLAGGLAGGAFYIAGAQFIHSVSPVLIGSSASVLAVVTAVAMAMPRQRMHLVLLGSVEIRWIALATVLLTLVAEPGGLTGSQIAHAGGIAAGAVWGWRLRRPRLRRSRRSGEAADAASAAAATATLDELLDKIRVSGYGSLTRAERDRLFDITKRM